MAQAQISTSRASFGDQTFEDGLSTTTRNSQHRSESSCSNSLSAPFTNRKVLETPKEAYSPCDTEEKNIATVGKSSVCSDISDGFNCTSKTVENIRSCEEQDNQPTPHSGEIEVINREISGGAENLVEFDLNEDLLNVDGSGDYFQSVIENGTSQGVVRVVVKIGVPSGWPVFPLEFAGGLGWKGPSKPSAFRPIAISKNSDRKMCFFTGIDLNVAAVEDSAAANGIILAGPCSTPQEGVDLKMAESPNFDLNRLCDDAGDEFTPENSHLLDLNLNVNTKKTIDLMGSGNRDFNPNSRDYLPSLNTMPPKFPFLSHVLPPQSYPPKGRLHVGLFNPGMVKAPFGNNHLEQVFHEQTGNVKTGQSRQYMFLANNSSMGERLQHDNWFRTSNKRKETEGGLEFYQHG